MYEVYLGQIVESSILLDQKPNSVPSLWKALKTWTESIQLSILKLSTLPQRIVRDVPYHFRQAI